MRPFLINNNSTRVALLTEIISPYRIPVLNHLAAHPNIDLDVFFFSETEGRRSWRIPWEKICFRYRVLPGILAAHRYQGGPIFFNPGIIWALKRGRFQTVVCFGYHHPTIWLALLWCRVTRTRVLLWSESTLQDNRSYRGIVEWFKRQLLQQFDSFVAAGTSQAGYLRHLGAHPEKIWIAPDAVDSDFFSSNSLIYRNKREETKQALNVEGLIVLYVGRLIDAKGIPELLEALGRVVMQNQATLFLVGDGPDRESYEQSCRARKLPVRFEGFRTQEELPLYYGVADVLVFPTHSDPWGLVLNEAMCSGLPVICSTAAGAAADLVRHGYNGFVYPPGQDEELSGHLLTLLADEQARNRMGSASREIIRAFSPQKMAEGFVEAVLGLRDESNAQHHK